jgi:hypothetical protein
MDSSVMSSPGIVGQTRLASGEWASSVVSILILIDGSLRWMRLPALAAAGWNAIDKDFAVPA